MTRLSVATPAFAAAVMLAPLCAQPTLTVTLEPDRDNSVYDTFPTNSNGAGNLLFIGTDRSGGKKRCLLRFDVEGAIAPGSVVTDARLSMTVGASRSYFPPSVAIHRVTAAWGEAGSSGIGQGAPAQPGDATWLQRMWPATSWTQPGGDFVATPSVSGSTSWPTPFGGAGLAVDVQAWIDGAAPNEGWIILGLNSAYGLYSREHNVAGLRPQLTVTFQPAAGSARVGSGCAGSGAAALDLAAQGVPTVPNPAFALDVTGGPVAAQLALAVHADAAAAPITLPRGCAIYGDLATLLVVEPVGSGRQPLPVPNLPALIGARLFFQVFGLEPGGLVSSNGLWLYFG